MIRFNHKKSLAAWLAVAVMAFMILSPLAVAAEVKTVVGQAVEKDGEIVIQTGGVVYILDGNVEKFIGKKVEASGELAKDDAGALIILVDSIKEVE